MESIDYYKEKDKELLLELGIPCFCRAIGYSTSGDPIELVFNSEENEYEWHIGGEYVKLASNQQAMKVLQSQ